MTARPPPGIEIVPVAPQWERPLAEFFAALVASGSDAHFHPHPFTAEQAKIRATYEGADLYYLLVEGAAVLGYGMLRGWDEGYDVPSLGIALHPDARGGGLGRSLMAFLHAAARRRGAARVRLTVDPANAVAVSLYLSLGYTFAEVDGKRVGTLAL